VFIKKLLELGDKRLQIVYDTIDVLGCEDPAERDGLYQ